MGGVGKKIERKSCNYVLIKINYKKEDQEIIFTYGIW